MESRSIIMAKSALDAVSKPPLKGNQIQSSLDTFFSKNLLLDSITGGLVSYMDHWSDKEWLFTCYTSISVIDVFNSLTVGKGGEGWIGQ